MEKNSSHAGKTARRSSRQAATISLRPDGIESFLGFLPWDSLLRFRLYQRQEQKMRLRAAKATVRVAADRCVDIDFTEPESGTLLPARIREEAPGRIRIDLKAGDLVEPWGASWRLMKVEVAPGFIRAQTSGAGGWLLPIYGGAVAPFSRAERLLSTDRIYMQQSEWEKFGLFNAFGGWWGGASASGAPGGASDGVPAGEGILGIVASGDFQAWVETAYNQPGAEGVTSQTLVFGVRDDPADAVPQEDKTLLLRHVPGARDWTALSLAYRDWLLGEFGLLPLRDRMRGNPVLAYAVRAMRVKIFFGLKSPFVPDGSGPYRDCTTFAEAEAILDAMHGAGISRAVVTLVGWNLGGHDGAYPTHFPINSVAGGEDGLRRLIAKATALGYQIVPHDNSSSMYQGSPDFDRHVISKTRAGETQNAGLWSGGLTYITCPRAYMERFGGEFPRIKDLGFHGCYYIDGLATGLFRCHDPAHPATEREFALGQMAILGYARSLYGSVSTENPSTYSLPYIDEAAHVPAGDRCAFHRNMLEGDTARVLERYVPFFGMAVHGIIACNSGWIASYRADTGLGILSHFVEGARPSMEVSERQGGAGDKWRDSIRDVLPAWRLAFEVAPDLHEALVESYEEFAPDAARIRYDGGLVVEVNATDSEAGPLPARSLRILRKTGRKTAVLADERM